MSKQQRIALMSRASILVGLSSDDLMEAIWMPTGRGHVVIELFEEGGFQRDIEAFTTMLNLDYMAIQNDEVLTEKMWREHGRMRGPDKNVSNTTLSAHTQEVTVDANLVVRMVELQLHRL
jgi:hypothetical protein